MKYRQPTFSLAGWQAPPACDHRQSARWLTPKGYCVKCNADLRPLLMWEAEEAAKPAVDTSAESC